MKINEAVAGLENRIERSTRPWMRITAALLLLIFIILLIRGQIVRTSGFTLINSAGTATKASSQFGDALLKVGIKTQATPSR